jgi:hypothetical protein
VLHLAEVLNRGFLPISARTHCISAQLTLIVRGFMGSDVQFQLCPLNE